MKKFKKLISVILAVLMVTTVMPVTAFGAEKEDMQGSYNGFEWSYTAETDTLYINTTEKAVVNSYNNPLESKNTQYYLPTLYQEDGVDVFWHESFSTLIIGNNITELKNVKLGYCTTNKFYNYPDLENVEFEENSSMQTLGSYMFYKLPITEIEIPDSVTEIKDNCFAYSSLQEIELGHNIRALGDRCFFACKSLTTAVIDTTTKVSYQAFYECSRLTDVTIGNSVTKIGNESFRYCTELKSIDLHDGITQIGNFAFSSTALEEITLPASLTSIGDSAFAHNMALRSLTFPQSDVVMSIERYAFLDTDLGEVTIPGNVTKLYSYAFKNAGITRLTLSEGIELIDTYCFTQNNFESVRIPSTVGILNDNAFKDCKMLKHVNMTVNSRIKTLSANLFMNCTALESIDAPNVVGVSQYAFSHTDSLREVNIPKLRNVSQYAFQYSGIQSITFAPYSQSNTYNAYIGDHAFEYCSKLKDVKLPADLIAIYPYTFRKCPALRTIVLPNRISTVGEYAFQYDQINNVKVLNPDAVFDTNAFANCTCANITMYAVSPSAVEDYANEKGINFVAIETETDSDANEFAPEISEVERLENMKKGTWCNGTWSIDSSSRVLTIKGEGDMESNYVIDMNGTLSTFAQIADEYNVNKISIGKGVTSIADNFLALDENTAVSSVTKCEVPNTLRRIGDYAFANSNIIIVSTSLIVSIGASAGFNIQYFPNSCVEIGKYAFANCRNLYPTIWLSRDMETISEGCFYNSNITQVVTFGKLTSIDKKAFTNCNLTRIDVPVSAEIYSDNENPADNAIGFNADGTKNNSKIYARYNSPAYSYATSHGLGFEEYYGNSYLDGKIEYTAATTGSTLNKKTYTYNLFWAYYVEDNSMQILKGSDQESGNFWNKQYNVGTKLIADSEDVQIDFLQYVPYTDIIDSNNPSALLSSRKTSVVEPGQYEIGNIYVEEGITEIAANNMFSVFNPECVVFPSTLERLDYAVLQNCPRLKTTNIPDGVTSVDKDLYKNCDNLVTVEIGSGLISIPDNFFMNKNKLENVFFSEGLVNIGKKAFFNCTSLKTINLPNTVERIDERAFHNCIKAQSITLGNRVSTVGSQAFAGTAYCDTVRINSNAQISSNAFKDCGSLTSGLNVYFAGNAQNADLLAFTNDKINNLNIGKYVRTASNLYVAEKIDKINVDSANSYLFVDGNCLYSYDNVLIYVPNTLKEFTILSTTTAIADYACYRTSASTVVIPAGVTAIGNYAFADSRSLKSFSASNGLLTIGNKAFENCVKIRFVYLPVTVKTIGDSAFAGCIDLASVIFNRRLEVIGDEAFSGCTNLIGVVIPESVQTIGDRAFMDNTALEYAYIYGAELGTDVFKNDNALTIFTMAGSDAYRFAREYGVNYSAYTDEYAFDDECAIKIDVLGGYLGYCENGHGDIDYLVVYAADCDNDGFIIGVCEYCSEILEEIHIDAKGHDYKLVTNIPATASSRGVKTYTCSNCGESFNEYFEPTGEQGEIEVHSVTATVTIATNADATAGETPLKNVAVMLDGVRIATTDEKGMFTATLETGVYQLELVYAYGFTRTINVVIENSDIVYNEPVRMIACDFNKDGVIDKADTELFQLVISSKKNDPSYLDYVDLNKDGYINIKDRRIMNSCMGLEASCYIYEEVVVQL